MTSTRPSGSNVAVCEARPVLIEAAGDHVLDAVTSVLVAIPIAMQSIITTVVPTDFVTGILSLLFAVMDGLVNDSAPVTRTHAYIPSRRWGATLQITR